MKYTLEHIVNRFGSFWVIFDDSDDFIQREVFSSHDINEALEVLHELRGE